MTYTVALAEHDAGYGLYPLGIERSHHTASGALTAAREAAHEAGYMPREASDWERHQRSARATLACY